MEKIVEKGGALGVGTHVSAQVGVGAAQKPVEKPKAINVVVGPAVGCLPKDGMISAGVAVNPKVLGEKCNSASGEGAIVPAPRPSKMGASWKVKVSSYNQYAPIEVSCRYDSDVMISSRKDADDYMRTFNRICKDSCDFQIAELVKEGRIPDPYGKNKQ